MAQVLVNSAGKSNVMESKYSSMLMAMLFSSIVFAQDPAPFSFNSDITPSVETFQIQKYGNMTPELLFAASR